MYPTTAKILVVDDMKTMRKVVLRSLREQGYTNLVEAEDGVAAWTAIQDAHQAGKPFDLIISDWDMPKLKGIDLLRKLRADARTKNLPFLMLTAEAEEKSLKEATAPDTRASGFLNKPFRPEQLKEQMALTYAALSKKAA
jgi:two-component system, chemotaxis family, chemotaxis protein CheY